MHKPTREDRLVRLIHRNFIFLVVSVVIIGGLILINLYRAGLLGPIVGDNLQGFTLLWRVSDHRADNSLLSNSLTETDEPKYEGDVVLELERNSDGSLKALPRIQGQLEYHLD